MAPGPAACASCDTLFYLLEGDTCALCLSYARKLEDQPGGAAEHQRWLDSIRTDRKQCLSFSLYFSTATWSVEACRSCLTYWDKRSPPQGLKPHLVTARARHGMSEPGGLATEPSALQRFHLDAAQRGGSVTGTVASGAGYEKSLADSANAFRASATNLRISGKPTTASAVPSASHRYAPNPSNAATFHASKSEITHNQRVAKAVGTSGVSITSVLWVSKDVSTDPKKASNAQETRRFPGESFILDALSELLDAAMEGTDYDHLTLSNIRVEVAQSNTKHPNLSFLLADYTKATNVNAFWTDVVANGLVKVGGKVGGKPDERRNIDLRFVYTFPAESPAIMRPKRKYDETVEFSDGESFAEDQYNDNYDPAFRAQEALGDVFSMSLYRPPQPLVQPPQPLFSRRTEDWEIAVTKATCNETGTVIYETLPTAARIIVSTILQENHWLATKTFERRTIPSAEDGFIGVGATKVAILAECEGEAYVAAMHRSGEGWTDSGVPGRYSQENFQRDLLAELGALAQADYFNHQFQARVALAKVKGTLVPGVPEIKVAHEGAFVAKLLKRADSSTLERSGGGEDANDTTETFGCILPQEHFIATKLIGALGSKVLHFTAHDPVEDPKEPPEPRLRLMWHLVRAFAHFVFESSGETCVLADLQGILQEDKTLCLFDVIAHSEHVEGITPMWFNWGDRGLNAFRNTHLCNTVCVGLGLVNLAPGTKQLRHGVLSRSPTPAPPTRNSGKKKTKQTPGSAAPRRASERQSNQPKHNYKA